MAELTPQDPAVQHLLASHDHAEQHQPEEDSIHSLRPPTIKTKDAVAILERRGARLVARLAECPDDEEGNKAAYRIRRELAIFQLALQGIAIIGEARALAQEMDFERALNELIEKKAQELAELRIQHRETAQERRQELDVLALGEEAA